MKRVLTLVVALGAAALFSNAALAGADCAYHKTQAAVDKTDKTVMTAPAPDKTDASQLRTAQAEQPVRPAPETKK